MSKVVLVKERGEVRVLTTENKEKVKIDANELSMRSRLSSGDLKYYELEYDESMKLEAFVAAINMYPHLLETSKMIKAI